VIKDDSMVRVMGLGRIQFARKRRREICPSEDVQRMNEKKNSEKE
jgi:hypothetical protein